MKILLLVLICLTSAVAYGSEATPEEIEAMIAQLHERNAELIESSEEGSPAVQAQADAGAPMADEMAKLGPAALSAYAEAMAGTRSGFIVQSVLQAMTKIINANPHDPRSADAAAYVLDQIGTTINGPLQVAWALSAVAGLHKGSIPLLIDVLSSEVKSLRQWSQLALLKLTQQGDLKFDYTGDSTVIANGQAAWREWWEKNSDALVWDNDKKQLVEADPTE